ncbi:HET-domain-containing protein [Xylariaceae sp. FL0662B]|nr:HET-domain-containing protein [Xylariaceae sp. FL0662B]
MWLLNVHTRKLVEFVGDNRPRTGYVILSHTWGEEEVTFQDLSNPGHTQKLGYAKIEGSCQQAIRDNYSYVWIDTCCIDKSSSSELSEAINSMFAWYGDANVCYVYLVDVPTGKDPYEAQSAFRCSRWFTRGWTLQELLAPCCMYFFDANWEWISSTFDPGFYGLLADITKIPEDMFGGRDRRHETLNATPAALKLSWMSERVTTREEDMAYCLLGLVGVKMPLLYGEGSRAFGRLQEEIIKVSTDLSVLAYGFGLPWIYLPYYPLRDGVLAESPVLFRGFGNTKWATIPLDERTNPSRSHWEMTNHGLHIEMMLVRFDIANRIVLGILQDYLNGRFVALPLRQQGSKDDVFERVQGYVPIELEWHSVFARFRRPGWRRIYIQDANRPTDQIYRSLPGSDSNFILTTNYFSYWKGRSKTLSIQFLNFCSAGYKVNSVYPPNINLDASNIMSKLDPRRKMGKHQYLVLLSTPKQDTVAFCIKDTKRGSWKDGGYTVLMAHADARYTAMEYFAGSHFPQLVPVLKRPPKLDWQKSIVIDGMNGSSRISIKQKEKESGSWITVTRNAKLK